MGSPSSHPWAPLVPLLLLGSLLSLLPSSSCALRLFFFGDSLLDTGNNIYLTKNKGQSSANFPPYGRALVPPGPTGRHSDGKIFTDFLSEKAGLQTPFPILQKDAPRTMGANFATTGSGALNETVATNMTLFQQLKLFRPIASSISAAELASESIAILSTGSNDILNKLKNDFFFFNARRIATASVAATIVFVKELQASGIRNFIIFNTGPLGCLPIVRYSAFWLGGQCLQRAEDAAAIYNTLLNGQLIQLRKEIPNSNFLLLDIYTGFTLAAKDIGVAITKGGCCGSPLPSNGGKQCGVGNYNQCANASQYMFWDNIHPTEAATKRIFDYAWSGSQVSKPSNIQTLFQTLNIPPPKK